MCDYYKKIINEFKKEDTITNFDELIEYLKQNNLNDIEDDIKDLELNTMVGCSINTGDIFLPIPSGTNIFSIYNPIQSVNAIIPDIFRLCAIKNPIEFEDSILSTRVSPKIKVAFEDTSLGTAINVTRFQQLIPENIIKAFFYFGYKSNFENFNFSELNFLEKKIENYVKISQTNNSKYTDPEVIFNSIYGTDTLIQNMIQLHNLLQKVKEEKTDLTNIGSYNLPYLFTYYSIATIFLDSSITSTKYSNFRDKNTTTLSYTDLVYLNYLNKLINDNLLLDNILILLNSDILGYNIDPIIINNLNTVIDFTKKNNIFVVIKLALEVKQYILNVISYNLNNKTYNISNYAKPSYLLITKKLYCNYSKNESYNYPELNVPDYCL